MNNLNLNLLRSSILGGGPGPIPAPNADFTSSATGGVVGVSIDFIDTSTNSPTSWLWNFEGGTPSSSTSQNPSVTYSATGSFDVSLYAGNTGGTGYVLKENYIEVTTPNTVVDTFTSNATWYCCTGATCVEVIAIGGGGGGAAGGASSSTTDNRGVVGGAGGGGGAVVIATITAAQLAASTVPIVVGGAGSGGAGVSPTNQGNIGTDGGASCFGGFLTANGGKTPLEGGYINAAPGGVNGCAGVGGTGVITCGTGTVCAGGNGGYMNATCYTDINGGPAANVDGTTRTPGGGAGGSMWYLSGVTYSGNGGVGRGPNTVCDIQLGASGRGGNAPGGAGVVSAGYGAGGAGGAANRNAASASGRPGTQGFVKVIQYFS